MDLRHTWKLGRLAYLLLSPAKQGMSSLFEIRTTGREVFSRKRDNEVGVIDHVIFV